MSERNNSTIKFSEEYYKFGSHSLPFTCRLLQCFKVHYNDLSEMYISYDTTYPHGNYPLPKTDLIVLLLWTVGECKVTILTTIRRWTPQKWKYYKSLEGELVDLVKC